MRKRLYNRLCRESTNGKTTTAPFSHNANMTNDISVDELIKRNPDVDPFLIRKWEHIFTLFFDRNCSHEIDWGDFYLVLRKVREIYGAESVQTAYARKSMEVLWVGLQKIADSDANSTISIEEWIHLLKQVSLKDRTEPKWFDDYSNFMYKLFNVSGTNELDIAEYSDGMEVYGHHNREAHEAFSKFAVDKKGQPVHGITPKQWETYFLDLFFSNDKKALGNHLFGILDSKICA